MEKLLSCAAMIAVMTVSAHAATPLDANSAIFIEQGNAPHAEPGRLPPGNAFGRAGAFSAPQNRGNHATGPATVSAVPEPGTWAMIGIGAGIVGFAMRRRSKTRTTVSFV